jgi:hypothetical protein
VTKKDRAKAIIVCDAALVTTASHCILDALGALKGRRFVSGLSFRSGADYWSSRWTAYADGRESVYILSSDFRDGG